MLYEEYCLLHKNFIIFEYSKLRIDEVPGESIIINQSFGLGSKN